MNRLLISLALAFPGVVLANHPIADVIWLSQDSDTSPEMGMLSRSNGLLRTCVWLDEERIQTDFGRWSIEGSSLLLDFDRQGDSTFQVLKRDTDTLVLGIEDQEISLGRAKKKFSNRCVPIFEVWEQQAMEYPE